MKHSFDLDDFESFLSEQADKHRMYASDRVWHRIQASLHGKGRWPALTFAALLTTSVIAVVLTLAYPKKQMLEPEQPMAAFTTAAMAPIPSQAAATPRPTDLRMSLAPAEALTSHTNAALPLAAVAQDYSHAIPDNAVVPAENNAAANLQQLNSASENATPGLNATAAYNANNAAAPMAAGTNLQITLDENEFALQSWPGRAFAAGLRLSEKSTNAALPAVFPSLSHNEIQAPAKNNLRKSRWSIQWYATPSISYRYLLEDKKYVDNPAAINGPMAPYLTNTVDHFVRHTPKAGLEVGGAVLYDLADNFRVKAGLQLNYRQYGIEAFQTATAQPALLTLNTENGIDSIVRYSTLSTQAGYRTLNLSSNFLQIAIPVGFDLKMADTRKIDFYVSASGQLTYQLQSSNYVISADYKNYLRLPNLDRKLNFNTSVEAFASFEAGGVNWQVGPQIRYQLLPGSKSAYPIREHLIDYGLKVGIIKKIQ